MRKMKRGLSVLLALVLTFGLSVPVLAADSKDLQKAIQTSAAYLQKTVAAPQVSSIGGEWAVIGLARSGADVPEKYFETYYETAVETVTKKKGVLHAKKYTEYSRVALALTAIGADPSDVGGYDLLKPLADFEKVTWQGINGPAWALIALDSGKYEMPVNPDAKIQATRQMYVDEILSRQLTDGGWNLSGGGSADPDVTGMVLQALSNYTEQPAVKKAVEQALTCLSQMQDETGGFSSYDMDTSESVVQVIVALGELGIDLTDGRFVKNGNTLLDALMGYWNPNGSFSHTGAAEGNQMATEQGFYGMVAAQRAISGKNSLYRMEDVTLSVADGKETEKNSDLEKTEVTEEGKTFADIQGHPAQDAIEALASRGIISGMGEDLFSPDETMTRAQFASIMVRALGLPMQSANPFSDVEKGEWYWSAVGAAYAHGLVSGKTETTFDPNGMITRQEAASMVARAAKLCGMDTKMEEYAIQNMLTQFADYPSVGKWARESVAFCYSKDILDRNDWTIEPARNITRSEIAQMVCNLLQQANLL